MANSERPIPQEEINAAPLPAQQGNQRIEKVYHVFTHATDIWTSKRRKAEKTYRRFVRENGAARIYEEKYTDRENDVMISEDCLKAFGEYPM